MNQHASANTVNATNEPVKELVYNMNRGGDTPKSDVSQSKVGPGARAKHHAREAAKTGSPSSTGGSLFTEGYIPDKKFCHFHTGQPKTSSTKSQLGMSISNGDFKDAYGRPFKKSDDGWLVSRAGKKFVRTKCQIKTADFQTPENYNDPAQTISDAAKSKNPVEHSVDISKRQTHAKFKHRSDFETANETKINTYSEFTESQVNFLKTPAENKFISKCIHLGTGTEPKDAFCIIDHDTRQCFVAKRKFVDLEFMGQDKRYFTFSIAKAIC